jgi:hypothetical protein
MGAKPRSLPPGEYKGKTITSVSQGFPVTFGILSRKRSRAKAGYIGKKFEPPKI